jgi:hypothetical protein
MRGTEGGRGRGRRGSAYLSRAATQVVRYKPSAEKRLFGVVCCWRRERSLARAELERSRARGKTPYEYDIAVNQVQAAAFIFCPFISVSFSLKDHIRIHHESYVRHSGRGTLL